MKKHLNNKESMNFDEFFAMSKEIVDTELKNNPNVTLDAQEVQATCLFCPYAEDKKR